MDEDMLEINNRRLEKELAAAKETLRDKFAMAIAPSVIAEWNEAKNFNLWPRIWTMADAMLAARNTK